MDLGPHNFVGYQFSLPFGRGILEEPEEKIATDIFSLESLINTKTVPVTYGSAPAILDRGILALPAGSRSILEVLNRRQVRAHIHGCFGPEGRHFNVATAGQLRGMLINLATMEHEVIGRSRADDQ